MRKKLIIATAAVSVCLVLAVVLLIYMETSRNNELPAATDPTSTVETSVQTEPSECTEFTDSEGSLIIVPDNDPSEQTEKEQSEEQTEYTPPEGLDEDETPIL